jgi:nucleoside-diphosphate-sugar epimerase
VRILVLGAAGMIGRRLVDRLRAAGTLAGRKIERFVQVDAVAPADVIADIADPGVAAGLASDRPDVIFHLAAVVSGEAEADFDKGYRVNVDGMRSLLEALRAEGHAPRLVFASSIAVFGPPLPEVIGDEHASTPATSYGTQKAIAELLLNDYSRRGFVNGIGIRLPTICVRPGRPNLAASGFFSSIIREPLNGEEAVLPVPETVRHWFASPRAAVDFLVHAAGLDTTVLGTRRCLTMPGLSATVAEQIEALRRIGGEDAVRLIRHERDETIARIVQSWPGAFDARRARELGFRAEQSFDEIVRVHVQDELRAAVA